MVKQEDEKKFKVQIFIHGKFEEYKSIKSDIVNLFLYYNCSLSKEEDLEPNIGYMKNLYFIDSQQLKAQTEENGGAEKEELYSTLNETKEIN